MNKCRWIAASVVAAVAMTVMDSILHGVLLKGIYVATAALWRPEAEMLKLLPVGMLSTLFLCLILVYIYHRGYEGAGSGLAEGLRFGFWIGLFMGVPGCVWAYITVPIPLNLAVFWFVGSLVEFLVAGMLIGLIYKPTSDA
jgi:hypothetical protein